MADLAISGTIGYNLNRSLSPAKVMEKDALDYAAEQKRIEEIDNASKATIRRQEAEVIADNANERSTRSAFVNRSDGENAQTKSFAQNNKEAIANDAIREDTVRTADDVSPMGRSFSELSTTERKNLSAEQRVIESADAQRKLLDQAVDIVNSRTLEANRQREAAQLEAISEDKIQADIRAEDNAATLADRADRDLKEIASATEIQDQINLDGGENSSTANSSLIAAQNYEATQRSIEQDRVERKQATADAQARLDLLKARIAIDDQIRLTRSNAQEGADQVQFGLTAELSQGTKISNQDSTLAESSSLVDGNMDSSSFRVTGQLIDRFV